jgi:hypothetical protein
MGFFTTYGYSALVYVLQLPRRPRQRADSTSHSLVDAALYRTGTGHCSRSSFEGLNPGDFARTRRLKRTSRTSASVKLPPGNRPKSFELS